MLNVSLTCHKYELNTLVCIEEFVVSLYDIRVCAQSNLAKLRYREKFILIPEVSFTKKEFAEHTSNEKLPWEKGTIGLLSII